MAEARRLAAWLYGVAAGTYLLDRVTKLIVERELAGRPPIDLIPGVLSLTYTTNSGGAFGLARSAPLLFVGATLIVAGAIVAASRRLTKRTVAIALGLILGGALGNLTDRAIHGSGLRGSVTDFIDLHVWPVFNLADSAIVVGAIVLAVSGWGRERDGA